MKTNVLLVVMILFLQTITAQNKKGFNLDNAIIPVSEIKDGGPAKDGIPSIDAPKFIKASGAVLDRNARILGVYENGIAKAYPISILNYHEIVNDHFGDQPVVVTFCPLCGSGIAFDALVKDKPKTFGVSGLLYNSDVLLYDRETESLWSQLKYQAVAGTLVGVSLKMLNTANTTWKSWNVKYPNTLVLSEDTGFIRDYSRNPYPGYEDSPALYFSVSDQDARFHPKETVIGVEINGKFKAYAFSELEKLKGKELKDSFEGKDLIIKYKPSSKSAEIFDNEANPIPAVTNFWFAWFAFHPDTEVYKF
jgi:uncharacterized protein (DUF983 family)